MCEEPEGAPPSAATTILCGRVMTEFTIVDSQAFLTSLAVIRIQVLAIDDEEDDAELPAIGCAICDAQGRPAGGLSIAAPSFQLGLAHAYAYAYAPLLIEAGGRIAKVIADCGPDGHPVSAMVADPRPRSASHPPSTQLLFSEPLVASVPGIPHRGNAHLGQGDLTNAARNHRPRSHGRRHRTPVDVGWTSVCRV